MTALPVIDRDAISRMSPADVREMLRLAEQVDKAQSENRLRYYRPYAKQKEFHANGAWSRERLLMSGNQLGKSYCGAAECAIHLTGQYPEWWQGRRFNKPVRAWVGSKTSEVVRDGMQRLLVGEPRDSTTWGTGLIPKAALKDWSRRSGVADALDGCIVRHASGGMSTLGFKTYDQGREKWQAETLDVVAFDEEPPYDIYMEGLTRTNATEGMVYLTFTPLLGASEVVLMFLKEFEHARS